MAITEKDQQGLDQLHAECCPKYKGVKKGYFALLYLTRKFNLRIEQAVSHIAFGNNDCTNRSSTCCAFRVRL